MYLETDIAAIPYEYADLVTLPAVHGHARLGNAGQFDIDVRIDREGFFASAAMFPWDFGRFRLFDGSAFGAGFGGWVLGGVDLVAGVCADAARAIMARRHTNSVIVPNFEMCVVIYPIIMALGYCILAISSSRSAIEFKRSILF